MFIEFSKRFNEEPYLSFLLLELMQEILIDHIQLGHVLVSHTEVHVRRLDDVILEAVLGLFLQII